MQLSSFEWLIVTIIGSILFGIVGYFLKRTMNRTDEHEKDINIIKQTYVTETDVKEIRGELQADVKNLKHELREEIKQLTDDVSEIKDNFLPKDDFYRTHIETDRKLERIQQILIELIGGKHNGGQ